jgi:hypothetical protein
LDNALGYTPENCQWVVKAAQSKNRSSCVQITMNGASMNLADWARTIGLTPNALAMRLRNGWSIERAISTPLRRKKDK